MATFTMQQKYVDDTVILRCEWDATYNIVTNTAIIEATLYYDTTARGLLNSPTISGNKASAFIIINNRRYNIDVSTMSGSKKHLVGTITSEPITLNDGTTTPVYIRCSLDFGASENFYDGLLSTNYVTLKSVSIDQHQFYLKTLYRASHISGTSGSLILGSDHSIIVEKANTEFTHTIEYICGTKSGIICIQSPDTVVPVNLPIDLATENTTSLFLNVDLKITTYYGDDALKTETVKKVYEIPESVAPSCSFVVSDAERLTNKYGGYVQKQSRFYINVTPTLSYGSPIVNYEITANGTVYSIETNTLTTTLIERSGKQNISVIVTDARGRTGTTSLEVDVLPWAIPNVINLQSFRTDENGNDKSGGEYITIHFDVEVSPLNNVNSASYLLRYQKISGLVQTDVELDSLEGLYSITDGVYTFKADTGSAYEITLYVTDDFATGNRTRGGSNAVTLMNFGADGESIGFGTLAKITNAVEIAFKLYPSGGFMCPSLEDTLGEGNDLYTVTMIKPNVYTCESGRDIDGSPTDGGYTLIVLPGRLEFDRIYIAVTQEFTPAIFLRTYINNAWSSWFKFGLTEVE